ncbi:hypothetical protein AIOL_004096 [Candidatus Rhodobacter oscarellae]|uniref:Uncharacterized protein n=1 Tax=Candidatus Rhodobacter oscarellae TaxID=1675527 RepID=A0A0J9E8M1_9RHOB|nr:hypothetical protein AIOL_004096 [Candidatus Rhodobacter lobularis]
MASIDHWQLVAAMYWIASQTDRMSGLRGQPPLALGGMTGAVKARSSSVQPLA